MYSTGLKAYFNKLSFIQPQIKYLDEWDTQGRCPVATVQILAPNAVNSTRWQRPGPGGFGLAFVQWEELVTLPLLQSMCVNHCAVPQM